MKFVALVSGGKDSCFNIFHCIKQGHELVALANLRPPKKDVQELDSFMFQTVGHDVLDYYSECMDVPMYRGDLVGTHKNAKLEYTKTKDDETEDLYDLLKHVLEQHPDITGVSVGAILSAYQRTRVEDVCQRLGLTSLAFLWQRDQDTLMREMISSGIDARIIKVAAIGLDESHLGLSLGAVYPHMVKLQRLYGVNICGEGGEFESIVLDAPGIFKKKLIVTGSTIEKEEHTGVCNMRLQVEIADKDPSELSDADVIPPQLDSAFDEILEQIQSETVRGQVEKLCVTKTLAPVVETVGTKIFISNIQPRSKASLSEEVADVFEQLKNILLEQNLESSNVQCATLLISDMANFQPINTIYNEFFSKYPLPPSRICVETQLPFELQLSCVAMKETTLKKGIHVQGRSYWAPANIGPYSQSIVDGHYTATLSGQIPLDPPSMVLVDKFNYSLQSVLSLQHLHKVKVCVGCETQMSLVSFVDDSNVVPHVAKAWDLYCDEFDVNRHTLIIVQVSMLPRQASAEWGGLSCNKIINYEEDYEFDKSLTSMKSFVEGNDGTFSVTFTGDSLDMDFDPKRHYTIYCNPQDLPSGLRAEYVPVNKVWSWDGSQCKYAVVMCG